MAFLFSTVSGRFSFKFTNITRILDFNETTGFTG